MRRIALLAAGVAALLLPAAPASAGELTDTCRSTDAALLLQGPCRGVEQVVSAGAAHCRFVTGQDEACSSIPLAPRVVRARIAEHEQSWLHDALAFQYELGSSVAMIDAPWVGTHNSANSVKQMPALSETDANQQLTLTEQLRLDIRSLELDLHSTPTGAKVCHGQGEGIGCTTERGVDDAFAEIEAWLGAHPRQVLLLYLEDHLNATDEATAMGLARARLDPLPASGRDLATLTRDEVRAAGAQTILVGGPGASPAWRETVFHWNPIEFEDRPRGFAACANEGAPLPPYGQRIVRFYEDSTWLTQQAEIAGQSRTDDGLRAETVREMVACGVGLFGFDQIVPGDERLDATVWSWAEGVRPTDCAVLRRDGRWGPSDCGGRRPAACRTPAGGWAITSAKVRAAEADGACRDAGGEFEAPRTGAQNAALDAVTKKRVWIGI